MMMTMTPTSTLGNTQRKGSGDQAVNNILEYKMENLQLEGETDKLLPSPAPLQTPADNEGSDAHIVNNICLWCLEDGGLDHPSLCDRPAICLKCKRTGHVITDCRSSCRTFTDLRQGKEKKIGSWRGGWKNKKDKREDKREGKKVWTTPVGWL